MAEAKLIVGGCAALIAAVALGIVPAVSVAVSACGLNGLLSLKTVSIVTLLTTPPPQIILSILGLTGHVGMTGVAGTAIALSGAALITPALLAAGGCCAVGLGTLPFEKNSHREKST